MNKDATPFLNFQPIGLLDQDYWEKFTYWMANSIDPDQLASEKPTDLDLHCLQRQCISRFSKTRVNKTHQKILHQNLLWRHQELWLEISKLINFDFLYLYFYMKNVLFFEIFVSKLRMHKNNCSKKKYIASCLSHSCKISNDLVVIQGSYLPVLFRYSHRMHPIAY